MLHFRMLGMDRVLEGINSNRDNDMQANNKIENHTHKSHTCIGQNQHGRRVVLVNPENRDWTSNVYILCFGAYGWTRLMLWENHLEDALDTAVDWLAENSPGLLCDEEVHEAYKQCVEDGMSEEDAIAYAEEDTTQAGNCGNYLLSYEWGIVGENLSRDALRSL